MNAASIPSFSLRARWTSSAPRAARYSSIDSSRSATAIPTWWIPMITSVSVPSLTGLPAQLPRFHLRLQLDRRPVPLVASRLEHVQAGVIRDVEPAEVAEPEWAHRPVETLLDRDVDVLEAGHAGVKQALRLLGGGVQDAVAAQTADLLFDQDRSPRHSAGHRHPPPSPLIP